MKKKLVVIALAMSMIGTMFLTGCGGKKEESKNSITVMIPEWGAPSDELLKEFEDQSGVDVTVNEVSWDDIRDKVSTAASGDEAAADVVEVDWSWVGEFNKAGWLEPLDVSDEDKADIPTLETFTVDGQVLAMPYSNDFRLSYYNTADFEKAGLSEPQTWNDVYNDGVAIKNAGIKKYPLTFPLQAQEGTTTSLFWLAYTMNGSVFNQDGTFNEASMMAALDFEKKCIDAKLINPVNKSSSDADTYAQLTSNSASFMTGPTSFVSRVNDKKESKVVGKVQPILVPGGNAKAQQTMALPEAVGVTSFSKHKKAAKEFVKWYTSAETQKKLNKENSLLPTRNSVLNELVDNGTIKNAGALTQEAALIKSPFPNGVPSYYSQLSNSVFNAVNKMAAGDYTPEQAFKAMNDKNNELLAKANK